MTVGMGDSDSPTQLFKCPVCEGRGEVPGGFYYSIQPTSVISVSPCRACKAKGYIVL